MLDSPSQVIYLHKPPTTLPSIHPESFLTFLKVQSIRIDTLRLGYREPGDDGTQGIAGEEDPEHIRHAQLLRVGEVVEQDA